MLSRAIRVTAALALGGTFLLLAGSPAEATDVSTEAQLRTAFANDAEVDLLNDITLADCNEGDLQRASGPGPLDLDGHGFTITQTCVDNVMESDADLTLRNVTLTGGRDIDDGGAIDMNGADVTVIDSTLTDNCASDSAGAIENEDDDVTIIGSTLNDNRADDQAGAVRSKRGDILIVNSTVTQNSQGSLAAIDSGQGNDVASLTLVYDTIVENENTRNLCIDVPVTPPESDQGDEEDSAAPAQVNPANVNSFDAFASFGTVVALPLNGPNCHIDTPGSEGQNFSDDDTCGFTGTGDRENAGDPGLGALADNGGPTQTRLPADTSPLVDWIPLASCGGGDSLAGFAVTDDQRNVARPQGEGCEVGSVELEVVVPEEPPPAEGPIAAAPPFTG